MTRSLRAGNSGIIVSISFSLDHSSSVMSFTFSKVSLGQADSLGFIEGRSLTTDGLQEFLTIYIAIDFLLNLGSKLYSEMKELPPI